MGPFGGVQVDPGRQLSSLGPDSHSQALQGKSIAASWCLTVKPAGFEDLENEEDEITTFVRTFVLNPNHFPKCINMNYQEIV